MGYNHWLDIENVLISRLTLKEIKKHTKNTTLHTKQNPTTYPTIYCQTVTVTQQAVYTLTYSTYMLFVCFWFPFRRFPEGCCVSTLFINIPKSCYSWVMINCHVNATKQKCLATPKTLKCQQQKLAHICWNWWAKRQLMTKDDEKKKEGKAR